MSDLFENLVERGSVQAQLPKPKLPSLFEVPEATSGSPPAAEMVEEREQKAPPPSIETPRNPPELHLAHTADIRSPAAPPQAVERIIERATAQPAKAEPAVSAVRQSAPLEKSKHRESEPNAPLTDAKRPRPVDTAPVPPEIRAVVHVERSEERWGPLAEQPAAIAPVMQSRRPEPVTPLLPQPGSLPESPRERRLVQPLRVSLAQARQAVAALSTSTKEPTIHVTIGRVEIRAALPGSAPTQERSPSPVMPLEEYLRSRRGRSSA